MFQKIAFIGAGSMAEAIISGMIQKDYCKPEQIVVTNKSNQNRLKYLQDKYKITISQDKEQVMKGAEIIVLTMKPADIVNGINDIKPYLKEEQLIISVLAGISTDFIAKQTGKDIAVIRAMPNTSAMIGQSATAITPGVFTSKEQLGKAKSLLKAIGMTTIVNEDDMHAITALAGSGPAFYYYMVEAMEIAAEEAGISEETAKALITQTFVGVAEMLKVTDNHPAELRKKITSPGGTTQAGLEILEQSNFQRVIVESIKAATERSNQLGKKLQEK
ncbi:pyrroline-5-carboxylate reductase [Aquibacillus rhizosphaerae]|uniref:Pyrroline-5-carboxylate reductase n=1 Tax=Aquibacillus rhizosphaerae TaxID=3051431 RepID=A0ABT7L4V8_9BACI|nr:pyrroline-5-carboxylate reductase [Aquibacillus sp. LR5S19]MDL4840911.1 pyrroline-5-carboxylate reductase [Aquibacillus sp. LR5S19]